MIKSMTGFGQAEGAFGAARLIVEIRTVNHRFFSPGIKLPSSFSKWEVDVREVLRRSIGRGHVTLNAKIEAGALSTASVCIDEERFAIVVARLKELKTQFDLEGPLLLADVLRMPDVMIAPRSELESGSYEELVKVVNLALENLERSRVDEGSRLEAVLRERLSFVETAVGRIAARAPDRLVAQRERLRNAVQSLLDGNQALDELRLAQEIAFLADRLDVAEELDRFASHIAAFRDALDASAEPTGKRLGFLLQELLREANTTGSKASDAVIQQEVIGIKEELERIREQVENIE